MALVLATLVLFAGWTGATSTRASSTSATFIEAPVLLQFFCVLSPKISTGLEKLAPTGWHGWHVFATLHDVDAEFDDDDESLTAKIFSFQ